MNIVSAIKDKVMYVVLGKFARDIAEGKHGPKAQAIYLWSKGKKTVTGMLLFLVFGAIVQFDPPYAATFFKVCTAASGMLMGLGLLDAGWNNKPAFPIWFLESLNRISGALTVFHGALIPFTELIHNVYPNGDTFLRQVMLLEAAISLSCGYVNRYTAAALAPPPQVVPATHITGEFSLKEVIEAVKSAPLVSERRAERRGIETDAISSKVER